MERILNVGDEVYVYKDFWKSLKDGTIIRGVIVHTENYDYGYHGSGDWHMDYTVKGEDGNKYYANHDSGYKPFRIATKEEIIESIKNAISNKEELKIQAYQELSDEAIGKYIKKYIKTKKKNYHDLNKEINELSGLLEEFKSSEIKGRQYIKRIKYEKK